MVESQTTNCQTTWKEWLVCENDRYVFSIFQNLYNHNVLTKPLSTQQKFTAGEKKKVSICPDVANFQALHVHIMM